MRLSRTWGAGAFSCLLFAAAVLPARTAGAQIFGSDPEGLKRTDNLIKKAEELVKQTESARAQLGKTLDTYDWKAGKAYWLGVDPAGQTHADVNDTSNPIEVIVVELKKDR